MALPPREDGRAHDRRQDGHGRRRPARRTCARRSSGRCSRTSGPSGRSCERRAGRARPARAEDLRRSPNPLAADYARFRVGERLLLTGHSHQAWPDVALEGAGRGVRRRRALRRREVGARVREGRRGARRASARCSATRARRSRSAQNTHELVAAVPLGARPPRAAAARDDRRRVPHAAPPARPARGGRASTSCASRRRRVDTLAERLAAAVDDRTAAVLVSAVLFETARIVPGLDALAARVRGAAGPSCWSTSTTSSGRAGVAAGARADARVGRRRRLQVPAARRGQLLPAPPAAGGRSCGR